MPRIDPCDCKNAAGAGKPLRDERTRKPLSFSHHSFRLSGWERERIHRYSVKRPAWFSLWLKLRGLAAKVGIG